MNKENLTYERLLDKLKHTEPVLHHGEELTDRIMQRVEQSIPSRKENRIMRVSAVLSGAAASLLVGWLAYETLKYPTPNFDEYSGYAVRSYVLDDFPTGNLDAGEKIKIAENYLKRREIQRAQKERLRAKYMK